MEQLFAEAWRQGGFALAFLIMFWAYREKAQQFADLQKSRAEATEADRDTLLRALEASTKAHTEAAAAMQAHTVQNSEAIRAIAALGDSFATHRGLMEQGRQPGRTK